MFCKMRLALVNKYIPLANHQAKRGSRSQLIVHFNEQSVPLFSVLNKLKLEYLYSDNIFQHTRKNIDQHFAMVGSHAWTHTCHHRIGNENLWSDSLLLIETMNQSLQPL
ncbi:hypothetical protein MANES_S031916v8 [Manihot esculenta]|uniref:Uncharacterized protein n=1 Tax=Manihot esculenta TaxID=3983 RepID=A0ACB7FUT8_MANES|nr:hypothetical protein MANES_S031916v8 [Manihot esculenta]